VTGYLDAIVRGEVEPGRYRLGAPVSVRELRDELTAAGWATRLVDGAVMRDRASMFDEFAAACEFPEWFGGNWDAFVDCLRDLSWIPGKGVVVLWRRSAVFAAAAPGTWENVGPIIDDAIESRIQIAVAPLFVLYPAAPDADGLSDAGGSMLRPVR
jgi:hypothetical protein